MWRKYNQVMTALNIFKWIGELFTEYLFLPFDFLRNDADMNWWLANGINWLFVLIGFVLLAYWMGQAVKFKREGTEDKA